MVIRASFYQLFKHVNDRKKIKRHKDPQDVENGFHKEQKEGCEHHPGKSMDKKKKKKESGVKSKTNAESAPSTVQTNDDMFERSPTLKRYVVGVL